MIYNAIADINLQRYELKTHSVLSTKARNEVLMMLLEPLPQTFSFLKHKQTDICCTTSAPLSLFFFPTMVMYAKIDKKPPTFDVTHNVFHYSPFCPRHFRFFYGIICGPPLE